MLMTEHNFEPGARVERAGARSGSACAFTMIEMIVVVIIIGILATAIVPRMLNIGQRQAELEAKSVQRLLSIAAEKSTVWNQPVAVDFQDDKHTLSIWTMKEDAKATAETTGAARVRWVYDTLVEPVVLDRLRISTATQDGQSLSATKWRVSFSPGQPRPVLAINLEPKSERDGPRWSITLPAGEATATRTASGGIGASGGVALGAESRSVDLDDSGKGDTPW